MIKRHNRHRKGIVLIWYVLATLLMIAFIGIAVDTGYLVLVGQQLQNAADASALAGAQRVRGDADQARLDAQSTAAANFVLANSVVVSLNSENGADGDIVVGWFDEADDSFTPQTSPRNAIRVRTRRTGSQNGSVPMLFAPIFGIADAEMTREAIAMVGGSTGAGIIALSDSDECAFSVDGNPTVVVDGGVIQVNSVDDCAVCLKGNFYVDAPSINVVGDWCQTGNAGEHPLINPGSGAVPDPLAWLPEPDYSSWPDLGGVSLTNTELSITPGYYSGGISMTGGTLNMEPGVYVLDGDGFDISGNANIFGEGVMLFITGDGHVDLTGTGVIYLRPMNIDDHSTVPGFGYYEGITFFQARDNDNSARIIGTSNMDIEGTVYFPHNHVDISGTSDKLGTQFIAWTMQIQGNGNLTLNYNGQFPAPGNIVYLVE